MSETALGLVETWGLVAAVAGADVALKAAPVELLEVITVGDGLVTVTLVGSVAAAQLAVEEASRVAATVGRVCSIRVIARPDSVAWDTVEP